ncbi:MAG: tetratricopeptide repeat protein [Brucellaceae bacterium]|nr:tetratricopeptide repeat protein [Brucellaceae bacterium]
MSRRLKWMYLPVLMLALAPPLPAVAEPLSGLSPQDAAEFSRMEEELREWDGGVAPLDALKVEIEHFMEGHPDFVPAEVLQTHEQWARIALDTGQINSSQSMLPLFLHYQKLVPDYPPAFINAAYAYVVIGDTEGAVPSLKTASRIAPDSPWVDLTWAFYHDRKREHEAAAKRARTAISKAKGDPIAAGNAVVAIAKHRGIADTRAAVALADEICLVQCDAPFLTTVMKRIIDHSYTVYPGLIDTAAALAERAAEQGEPGPELLLQWARAALIGGGMYRGAAGEAAGSGLVKQVEEVLLGIKDEPSVAEDVWGLLIDIALRKNALEEAEALIAEGHDRGYSASAVGNKAAALLYAERKPLQVLMLYEKLNLPEDGRWAEAQAQAGDLDRARRYYERIAQDNPTDANIVRKLAQFLLFYTTDTEQALRHGLSAHEQDPSPLTQQTVAATFLSLSGQHLKRGDLDQALRYYKSAEDLGYDADFAKYMCWRTCDEVTVSINAFR